MQNVTNYDSLVNPILNFCAAHDAKWIQRQRKLNTKTILAVLAQQVLSTNNLGAGIAQSSLSLGENDYQFTESAFSQARKKVGNQVFYDLFREKVGAFSATFPNKFLWKERRIFAIDGSKINLPLNCKDEGFQAPNAISHYPQALLTVLYQLRAKIPHGYDISKNFDERRGATQLMQYLQPRDIVVFDRGFFLSSSLGVISNLVLMLSIDYKKNLLKKLKLLDKAKTMTLLFTKM